MGRGLPPVGSPVDNALVTELDDNQPPDGTPSAGLVVALVLGASLAVQMSFPELIGSDRMVKGMQLLRDFFTYIVIDSPPALELSDPYLLSRHTDGLILVARAAKTPKQALRKVSEQLSRVGARIFGVVLNDVTVRGSEYGHHGRYGHYLSEFKKSPQAPSPGAEHPSA